MSLKNLADHYANTTVKIQNTSMHYRNTKDSNSNFSEMLNENLPNRAGDKPYSNPGWTV